MDFDDSTMLPEHLAYYLRALQFDTRIDESDKQAMAVQNGVLENQRAKVAAEVKVNVFPETHLEDNKRMRQDVSRSFISDTITVPTPDMYAYALDASLGDDVYHEPCTIALEAHIARITGKEAAIYMPTGTMSNQIALRTHLKQPPYSILCDHRAHIHKYEAGGAAFHSGAAMIPVIPKNLHHLTLSDVRENVIIGTDIHFAPTELIALENTLNGTIIPQRDVIAISEFAHENNIKMHLDGARIWHVAAETGTPLTTLLEPFDSVSLCLSKGLGAPVGSCLVGTKEFVTKARWFRKLFGGGMRQTGFLVACAAYAITHNFPRLPAVHVLAAKLEAGLRDVGVTITSPAETCMVFYDPSSIGADYAEIAERAAELKPPIKLFGSRLVVHIQTSEQAIDDLISLIGEIAEEKRAAGFIRPAHTDNTPPSGLMIYGGGPVRRNGAAKGK